MANKRRNNVRFHYGICLNDECPKCKSKEVQQIQLRKDLVCEECGKPLRECPPPKQNSNKKWILIALLTLLVVGGAIALFTMGGGSASADAGDTSLPADTPAVAMPAETVKDSAADSLKAVADSLARLVSESKQAEAQQQTQPQPVKAPAQTPTQVVVVKQEQQPAASSGTKNLGYATFKGRLVNGQPDDVNGRLIFKTSHVIDSRDPKARMAEAGDYVIGEFSEGHLVQGIWYGADNQVKGSVIIGK